ncbi:MAG: pyridoxamine 5'-phosphate oxidase family protein [Rhodothermaceae bacterium]|nr:pyridoxamine 5'-phosphate oxidase family protein [Rhodothermaceae bacterium]
MSKTYDAITPALTEWIEAQPLFFVATAPTAEDGLINCSPKGLDTFRILGPHEVAYLDLTGSGVETIAHVRENGRIVFMFCAFAGPPNIVRLHGTAEVLLPDTPDFEALRPRFPDLPGTRAILRASLTRISDSCGYAVPRMVYQEDRDTLVRWAQAKQPEGLAQYKVEKNTVSLDGLPGLEAG